MKKYYRVMLLTLQTLSAYRLNFLTRTLVVIATNLVLFGFWYYLAQSGVDTSPYTISSFAYYYLLVAVINSLISFRAEEIMHHIRKGEIVGFLLKPISYLKLMLSGLIVERLLNALLALGVFAFLIIAGFSIKIEAQTLLFFLISLALAVLMNYFFYFSIGLLSFWFVSIYSFSAFVSTVASLFSGGLIPLELLPESLENWSKFLPFRYLIFFPIQIFLQKIGTIEILLGLLIEVFWIVVFYQLGRIFWRKGSKQLEAVGI